MTSTQSKPIDGSSIKIEVNGSYDLSNGHGQPRESKKSPKPKPEVFLSQQRREEIIQYLGEQQQHQQHQQSRALQYPQSVLPPGVTVLNLAYPGLVLPGVIDASTMAAAVYNPGLQQQHQQQQMQEGEAQPPAPPKVRKPPKRRDPDLGHNEIVSCDLCAKTFKSRLGLKTHVKNNSCSRRLPMKNGPHKCQYCPRAYATKTNKDNHEKLHSNPNAFDCSKCGKRFLSYSGLRRHSVYTPCE